MISREVGKHVKVALSGDGGDELFAGYPWHRVHAAVERYMRFPGVLRHGVVEPVAGLFRRFSHGDWPHRIKRFLAHAGETPQQMYFQYRTSSFFNEEEQSELLSSGFRLRPEEEYLLEKFRKAGKSGPLTRALLVDFSTFLPDDLLVKTDTTSMMCGLEVRAPFLDHRLVEYAMSLSDGVKLRRGQGKFFLRKALRGMLPDEILRRGKVGFSIPIHKWFRGPWKEVTRDKLLSAEALARGIWREDAVRKLIDDHVAERALHGHRLWALLVLDTWCREFLD